MQVSIPILSIGRQRLEVSSSCRNRTFILSRLLCPQQDASCSIFQLLKSCAAIIFFLPWGVSQTKEIQFRDCRLLRHALTISHRGKVQVVHVHVMIWKDV